MTVQVLREVRLYGPLRARFGRSHHLAVDSPAEAVQALSVLLPGFRQALLDHQGPGFRVIVGEGAAARHCDESTLALGAGAAPVIRIAPVVHGNKRGLGAILAGAALLVLAPYAFGLVVGYTGSIYAAAAISAAMPLLGKALVMGGVMQLLSPQRMQKPTDPKNQPSYLISGATNQVGTGGPVPLIIGRCFVGSVPVSAGLSSDEANSRMPTPPFITLLAAEMALKPLLNPKDG